jgi:hypothetical protein
VPIQSYLSKIISGGQTGVDRAALDFAIACGIPHGGWCPRGRLAEDGIIPPRYNLTETPTADPAQRTEWNVRDSDATLILSINPTLQGGSAQTRAFAQQTTKPWLHLSWTDREHAQARLLLFLAQNSIRILNVAGPRLSEEPAVYQFATDTLHASSARKH